MALTVPEAAGPVTPYAAEQLIISRDVASNIATALKFIMSKNSAESTPAVNEVYAIAKHESQANRALALHVLDMCAANGNALNAFHAACAHSDRLVNALQIEVQLRCASLGTNLDELHAQLHRYARDAESIFKMTLQQMERRIATTFQTHQEKISAQMKTNFREQHRALDEKIDETELRLEEARTEFDVRLYNVDEELAKTHEMFEERLSTTTAG